MLTIWGLQDLKQNPGTIPRKPQELWTVRGLPPGVTKKTLGLDGVKGHHPDTEIGDLAKDKLKNVAQVNQVELMFIDEFEQLSKAKKREAVVVYLRQSSEPTPKVPAAPVDISTIDPRAQKLLRGKTSLFDMPKGQPPIQRPEFAIDLKEGATPRYRQSYRTSPKEDEELRKQLLVGLENDWIDVSSSEWASPVLFVPKKGGKMPMCIDYRGINEDTVQDRYPLPHMDDLIDSLWSSRIFTQLDLTSGYHQMAVKESDRSKTAFSTRYGLFEWKVLPFGLCNAPSAFMRIMNSVLEPHMRDFVVVYLDDILIFSRTVEEHERHVSEILRLLLKHDLKLSKDKCSWFQSKIEFVGFWIDEQGVHTDQSKIAAVQQWPIPTSRRQVRGFLGLTGFYRKFIQNYAKLAGPLYELTGHLTEFTWTGQCQTAFNNLKRALTTAPILMLPVPGQPFVVRSDASGFALGAVLLQKDKFGSVTATGAAVSDDDSGSDERVVAYFSRKFQPAEMRYPAYDRELLAIKDALRHWRVYLHGAKTMVYTDHLAIRHVL